jgi:uncharacterized protein (TIGR02001 family)
MSHASRTRIGATLGILLAIPLGIPVQANAADWGSISGSLAIASDYRFRGVSQSNLRPAPQAELDWNGPNDWTASAWASRIDFQDHQNTSIELDLSLDKRFQWGDTSLDVEALYHAYPDHHPIAGGVRYSAFEAIATVSHTWGRFSASGAVAWSPDNVGETGTGWDVEGAMHYALCEWLTIGGTAGRQWVQEWNKRMGAGYPYDYWDAGLTAHRGNLSLDLRYVGTTLNGRQCLLTFGGSHWCQAGLVTSLSYALGPS